VFGDNQQRRGKGGAAALRDEPNTYGFVTKKAPCNEPRCFYTPRDYRPVFDAELSRLAAVIDMNPDLTFLISRLGAGLANRYKIFETIIEPELRRVLSNRPNVRFLW